LKLFDTYGPDDPRPKLFALLKKVADRGEPLAMSPGDQLIDIVYIDDVVKAFVLSAEQLMQDSISGHESFAVSSGKPVRLRELVDIYSRVSGRTIPVVWGGRPYRPREVMLPWSCGNVLPGWSPEIGLEEGIRRMEHMNGEICI